MKLVNYTSKFSTNCVLHIETGRKFTKIMYMSTLPRVTKVLREDERHMKPINVDDKNNTERFIEIVRNRYLNSDLKTISQETADILGVEVPNHESEETNE